MTVTDDVHCHLHPIMNMIIIRQKYAILTQGTTSDSGDLG